jgi:tetratricopeptide (TPR) repeat protein
MLLAFFALFCADASSAYADTNQYLQAKSLAHYTMGLVYDMYGLTEYAAVQYEKANQFDDQNFHTHFKLGSNYARLGMLPEAIKELKQASELKPADLQSHYLLALIYTAQKDNEGAAREYEFILQSFSDEDPENVEIYGYLGQLYYSQGKYSEAVGQFEKILNINPDDANIMYLLGSLYLDLNERDKAIRIFLNAIEADPNHDGSLNSLAYVYAEDGVKLDDALVMARKANDIDPENGAYLDSLGWIHYKRGEYEDALETLKQADNYLKDPVIYDHIGDVYYQMNDYPKAQEYWKSSLELLPEQPDVLKKIQDVEKVLPIQQSKNIQ